MNLGLVLDRQDDSAGARRSFEKALALQPDLADAHVNLGVLHLQPKHAEAFRKIQKLKSKLDDQQGL